MQLATLLTILRKLPWRVLGPVLVALALALCVRHTMQASARANAYQRVAEMTANWNAKQEQQRQAYKKSAADTIARLSKQLASSNAGQVRNETEARQLTTKLRAELAAEQQAKLDSITNRYESALLLANSQKADLLGIVHTREAELADAEQRIAGLQRENAALHELCKSPSAGGSSTGWKVATAVATVVGVVAYATHP